MENMKNAIETSLYHDELLGLYFWGDPEMVEDGHYKYQWNTHLIDGGVASIIRTDL